MAVSYSNLRACCADSNGSPQTCEKAREVFAIFWRRDDDFLDAVINVSVMHGMRTSGVYLSRGDVGYTLNRRLSPIFEDIPEAK